MNINPNEICTCQNCDWVGSAGVLQDITNIESRVSPGEVMPAGECPECGALAHICPADELFDSEQYDTEAIDLDRENNNFELDHLEEYRFTTIVQTSILNGQILQARMQARRYGIDQAIVKQWIEEHRNP